MFFWVLYAIKKQGVAAICYNHFWAFAICYILLNGLCYMLLHTPWGALILQIVYVLYLVSSTYLEINVRTHNIDIYPECNIELFVVIDR